MPAPRVRRILGLALCVGLFLAAFIPRAYQPAMRSTDKQEPARVFATELLAGRWSGTYQKPHPAVTMMAISGLTVRGYYALDDTSAGLLFDWAIPPYVTDFGRRVALGAFALAFVIAGLVVLVALALHRLTGWKLAIAGAGLLAFSPYHLTHSRSVQLDGLLSTLMLLSALLLFINLKTGQRRYLMLSGFVGGWAMLTKVTALFLVPFTALTLLTHFFTELRVDPPPKDDRFWQNLMARAWRDLAWPNLLWVLMLGLPFAFWPAMWVEPIRTLSRIIESVIGEGTTPHQNNTFFAGRIYAQERPSPLFYTAIIVFKSSFITLTLSIVALILYAVRRTRKMLSVSPVFVWLLVAYTFFFALQMALGAKQASRYVLPSQLVMEIIAAIGLVALVTVVGKSISPSKEFVKRVIPLTMFAAATGLQAWSALSLAPDYGAHHNALLGGNRVAVNVVPIVEGNEGMLYVGDYLSQQPDISSKRVAAVFPLEASIIQYFQGELVEDMSAEADFYVFGRATIQRQIQPERWLEAWNAFSDQTPQLTVTIDGVEYLWLYDRNNTNQHIDIQRGWSGFRIVAWVWTIVLTILVGWSLVASKSTEGSSKSFP